MITKEYFPAFMMFSFASKILKGININTRDKKVPSSIEVFIRVEAPSSDGRISFENIKNIVLGVTNNTTNSIMKIKNSIKLRIFPFPGLKSAVFESVNIKNTNKKTDAKGITINSSSTDKTMKATIVT